MVKLKEIKINIATAIAAAFGFVIALIWKEIIIDLLKRGNLWLTATDSSDPMTILVPIITAIIVTIVCVIGIMYITKWGGVEKK